MVALDGGPLASQAFQVVVLRLGRAALAMQFLDSNTQSVQTIMEPSRPLTRLGRAARGVEDDGRLGAQHDGQIQRSPVHVGPVGHAVKRGIDDLGEKLHGRSIAFIYDGDAGHRWGLAL